MAAYIDLTSTTPKTYSKEINQTKEITPAIYTKNNNEIWVEIYAFWFE